MGKVMPVWLLVFCSLIGAWNFAAAISPATKVTDKPVIIDFFNEPGCSDCLQVKKEVLPQLEERFAGYYTINNYDVGLKSNVLVLMQYQDKLGIVSNTSVCMVVDYQYVLNGVEEIQDGLLGRVDESIAERTERGWHPPTPIVENKDDPQGLAMAAKRAESFTLVAVITAGLIDGINPCAISTLIFFMSLLAVSGVKGRGLLIMGSSFCLASFLTYLLIGLGFMRVLHAFSGFPLIQKAVEGVILAALVVLAILSFVDAWRYWRNGKSKAIILQLPQGIKTRIHGLMRKGLGTKHLVYGGFFVGLTVTALESICTGQVYVPTLVLVLKSGCSPLRNGFYLLLYNLMFMVPLVAIFLLTFFGLRTERLIEWGGRNVVPSKILLGLLFLGLAAAIIFLK
jgi:thiol-disulfide isomerase/thioredoxin